MKRRKTWFLAFSLVIMVSMAACPVKAASNKTKIKKVIKTYMAGAKKTNAKKMSKCFKKASNFNFTLKQAEKTFPYFNKVFKKNKKISYKFKSVKISGKTAVVKVRVKSPTVKKATDQAMIDFISYAFSHPEKNQKQYDKLFEKLLKKSIKKKGVQMYKHTMTFNMVKTAKGWKIKAVSDADYDLLFGRYFSIMKEYEKAWK